MSDNTFQKHTKALYLSNKLKKLVKEQERVLKIKDKDIMDIEIVKLLNEKNKLMNQLFKLTKFKIEDTYKE